jgi:uncharacterized protein YacL
MEQIREEKESFSISVTFTGLLAGFSFTAMGMTSAIENPSIAITVSFYAFLIATFMFLISTIGSWATLEWLSEIKTHGYKGKTFHLGAVVGLLLGFLTFSTGVVARAANYSFFAGILAAVLALLVFGFLIRSALEIWRAKKSFKI